MGDGVSVRHMAFAGFAAGTAFCLKEGHSCALWLWTLPALGLFLVHLCMTVWGALLVGAEQTELDLAYMYTYICTGLWYSPTPRAMPWCGGVSLEPSVLYAHRLTSVSVAGLAAQIFTAQGHSAVARVTPLAVCLLARGVIMWPSWPSPSEHVGIMVYPLGDDCAVRVQGWFCHDSLWLCMWLGFCWTGRV
jgi:hypothetical protein